MGFDAAVVEQFYRPLVAQHAAFYFGLPAPTAVGLAQIAQESGFNPLAKSPVGALGTNQFMPATWAWAAPAAGLSGSAKATDPEAAVRVGLWYDRFLYDRVRYPTECDRWGAALSAYNGGIAWHAKRQGRAADPQDFWNSVRFVNPGIADGNQRENEKYSAKIVFDLQPKFLRTGDRVVCDVRSTGKG